MDYHFVVIIFGTMYLCKEENKMN